MLNLEYYFNNCLDTKLKFIQTDKSFNSLITLFDSSRNNEFLRDIFNSVLSNNNKKKNYKNKLLFHNNSLTKKKKYNTFNTFNTINNTLRMTCLEGNIF